MVKEVETELKDHPTTKPRDSNQVSQLLKRPDQEDQRTRMKQDLLNLSSTDLHQIDKSTKDHLLAILA